jgi:hypothetical protein
VIIRIAIPGNPSFSVEAPGGAQLGWEMQTVSLNREDRVRGIAVGFDGQSFGVPLLSAFPRPRWDTASHMDVAHRIWTWFADNDVDPLSYRNGPAMADRAVAFGFDLGVRQQAHFIKVSKMLDRQMRYQRGERMKP